MRDVGLTHYNAPSAEPFARLLTQGMVLNTAYYDKPAAGGKKYYWEHEVKLERDAKGQTTAAYLPDGTPLTFELTTMSKSKNNGVDPQKMIETYGADTARFFMMFASPPEQTLEWSDSGLEGAHRFLRRVWTLAYSFKTEQAAQLSARPGEPISEKLPSDLASLRREIHL